MEHPANLGHIRTDDGEIGFKAADYLRSLGKFRACGAHAEDAKITKARSLADNLLRNNEAHR